MREKAAKQTKLRLRYTDKQMKHPFARALLVMSDILDAMPEVVDLVHADLVRGLKDPESGREGMTAEQVMRALIVKQLADFTYDDLEYTLLDSTLYRAFCRLGFDDDVSKSSLQRDIKKLRPETLEAVNRLLVSHAVERGIEKGRAVRIDCTVTATDIHEPKDSALLNDGVRVLTRLLSTAHEDHETAPRPDRTKRAKRRFLGILNAKNDKQRTKLYRDLLKVTRKTVRDAKAVAEELRRGTSFIAVALADEIRRFVELTERVISQTERRVLRDEKVPAQEKVVSIFEPHTDIIVKDRRETQYGHKLCLSVGASSLVSDLVVLTGNPADTTLAVTMIERQRDIYGRVPHKSSMDGGFASKANLAVIKALGVRDVAFSKKRGLKVEDMAKSAWVYRKLRDFRAGVEGVISYLKRCFGMRRCNWRGFESFKSYAWSSIIAMNLLVMARHILS
jgi:transposase, IS5 family